MVIRALSDLLPDDAVISLDCGANTHFAARCGELRANQSLTGTGMLASMAPGLSYGIAAKYAFPDRPSIVITGDGGFSMLMAELVTATSNKLPVKIILLKNNSLAEVRFEQEDIGNPRIGLRAGTHRFRWALRRPAARRATAASFRRKSYLQSRVHLSRRERLSSRQSLILMNGPRSPNS